jgi:hypothetical protein
VRRRILRSNEARAWRLAHLAEYRTARAWMIQAADLVVNTAACTPAEVAVQIKAALPGHLC